MQILQTGHGCRIFTFKCVYSGARPGDGGHVKHLVLQRRPAYGIGIRNRLSAFRSIYNEVYFIIFQQVHDMGPPLAHLVDALTFKPGVPQGPGCSMGGDQFKSEACQFFRDNLGTRFVRIPDADKSKTAAGDIAFRSELGLGEGPCFSLNKNVTCISLFSLVAPSPSMC